jgi:hypothetical protein
VQTTHDKVRVARGGGIMLLLAAVGLAALFLFAGQLFGFLDFGSKTIDRSQPPLLLKLTDLAEYHAATANFEVIVDLEKDVNLLPSFLAGQRALMVAAGTVDAQVDFSKLKDENIEVSPDRKSVKITLPTPQLGDVVLDQERTYVSSRSRGLFDRIGGVFTGNPTNDQPLYQAAEEKLRVGAESSELRNLAEANTRSMLESLMKSLGFERVEVVFVAPPEPSQP